jgi:hypothetical protein
MPPMNAAVIEPQVAGMLCWLAQWCADASRHADLGEGLVTVPLPVLAAVAAILRGDPSAPPAFPAGFFPLLVPELASTAPRSPNVPSFLVQ